MGIEFPARGGASTLGSMERMVLKTSATSLARKVMSALACMPKSSGRSFRGSTSSASRYSKMDLAHCGIVYLPSPQRLPLFSEGRCCENRSDLSGAALAASPRYICRTCPRSPGTSRGPLQVERRPCIVVPRRV
ncbi:hypothetical protein CYMTET_27269 [Cymbomonas tetramitiformis]|uniref:Uncharacterized protein n=1 Tax=Cymbomonas tetramitiformis TaxID=36881 RepID=A0AAE0FQ57_9CHLO|nr:hypothetical protein CYMTET_27269 [Cymbomonas tetramitiformis]